MPPKLRSLTRAYLPAWVYGRMRARRIRRYVDRYVPSTITHDYAGLPLTLHLHDPLAEGWYDRDWDEPAEIAELRRGRLRPGARVLDVGAHQGVVALILARMVGETGSVVAVEAERHNVAVAQLNAETNRAGNLTVIHAAAGATAGWLPFADSLNGYVVARAGPGSVAVPAVTIDDLADRYGDPDVVLIDVEGYESHVLRGAATLIAKRRTDFCIEVHSAALLSAVGSTAADVLKPFTDAQYDLFAAPAGDTPPGLGSQELATDWRRVGWKSAAELAGRRFFLVARPTDSC